MKPKLIYILSPSYSGSTLFTLMLARHPSVSTIGELKATAMGDLSRYRCSCQERILDCGFWKNLLDNVSVGNQYASLKDLGTHFKSDNPIYDRILRAQVRGTMFERVRRFLLQSLPGLQSRYEALLRHNRQFVDTCLELTGSECFVDGSKDPNRLLYFVRSDLFDVRVIYMVRDGRAQCNSQCNKPNWKGGFEAAAREWRSTIDQMDRAVSYCNPDQVDRMRYESLCQDPNSTMNILWRFLGLPVPDIDWGAIDLSDFEHHILGNNMRTKERIVLSLDERWRTQLDSRSLRVFASIAGKTNERLGFS